MSEKRILVVEDDNFNQEMMVTILEAMNFIVDVADDGEQASQILLSSMETFSLVMIDLGLPGKDGFELLEEILGNPHTENLPCIAMTAFHNSKLQYDALQAGFVSYYSKPVDKTRLRTELNNLTT